MAMYVVKYYDVETGHYKGQKACNTLEQAIEASTCERVCGEDDAVVMHLDNEGCLRAVPEELIAANWS